LHLIYYLPLTASFSCAIRTSLDISLREFPKLLRNSIAAVFGRTNRKEQKKMRGSRNLVTLAGASLLLAASAFAAGTGKGTLHLYETVDVQGKQLPPGDYKVEWNGEGPNVELSITGGKQSVASVPAQVVTVSEKNRTDGYGSKKSDDGKNALTEIFFHGKDFEFRVGEQASADANHSGTSGSNQ
jgi:hypothetical protein